MATVVAKFKVFQTAQIEGWEKDRPVLHQVKMRGVRGEPFGSATPNSSIEMVIANEEAAHIEMVIANEEAAQSLKMNQEYYVTFSTEPPPGFTEPAQE